MVLVKLIAYEERAFTDTSEWDRPRILRHLPDFLDRYAGKQPSSKSLSSASKKQGSPHTLVITAAGLRAADIVRYVGQAGLIREFWLMGHKNSACFPDQRGSCG